MKKQIRRLSPHQNGKVFAVLMTASALFMFVPMALIMSLTMPPTDPFGNPIHFPMGMFLLLPLMYLIFGYIFTAIGCAIYNFFYRFIGGIEFESEESDI